ncbi:MAG: hypothetical protein ACE5GJ_13995 [Gemmatimonadota bacterium]
MTVSSRVLSSRDLPARIRTAFLLMTGIFPVAGLLLLAACGSDVSAPGGESVPSRETFITAYVELRSAALRSDDGILSDSARTDILGRLGVTDRQLLRFVEVHGEDVDFMKEVWDEVEARLDAARTVEESG